MNSTQTGPQSLNQHFENQSFRNWLCTYVYAENTLDSFCFLHLTKKKRFAYRSKVKAPGIVLTEQGRSPGGKGSKFSPSSHGSPGNKVLESQLTAVQAVGQATIM